MPQRRECRGGAGGEQKAFGKKVFGAGFYWPIFLKVGNPVGSDLEVAWRAVWDVPEATWESSGR